MEPNKKHPFTIQRDVRKPKTHHLKTPRKIIKTEQKPVSASINGTMVCLPKFIAGDFPEKIEDRNAIQKQMLREEEEERAAFVYANQRNEFNLNWLQRNGLPMVVNNNQSLDLETQTSLSCGSYPPERRLQEMKYGQENKVCCISGEKMLEHWNEGVSLIESDDLSYYDFMHLEGVCGKEIKKFPIPFDKEIINFIENEDC